MRISVEAGVADPAVVALMDGVFIHAKGRSKSVAVRFPNVFGHGAQSKFIIAREGALVLGALAMRSFQWRVGQEAFSGVMVGFVCTAESARGQGIGTHLMMQAAKQLRADHADFGVLWTTLHRFYAPLGWTLSDAGIFAPFASGTCEEPQPGWMRADNRAFPKLEKLRTALESIRVNRHPVDYRVIPSSVDSVECWSTESGRSYALVGRSNSAAYVYEVLGSADQFPIVGASLRAIAPAVFLNYHPGSSFGRWVLAESGGRGTPQNQAMWLPLSARMAPFSLDQWYIPFFDRI
jgi:predicted N-acetyltransferase YhbS